MSVENPSLKRKFLIAVRDYLMDEPKPEAPGTKLGRRLFIGGTAVTLVGGSATAYTWYQREKEGRDVVLRYGDKPYIAENLHIFNQVPDLELVIRSSTFRNTAAHRGVNILRPPVNNARAVMIYPNYDAIPKGQSAADKFFPNGSGWSATTVILQDVINDALRTTRGFGHMTEITRQLNLKIFQALRGSTYSSNSNQGIGPEMTEEGRTVVSSNPPIILAGINPDRIKIVEEVRAPLPLEVKAGAEINRPQLPEANEPDEKLMGFTDYQKFEGGVVYNNHPDLLVSVSRSKLDTIYNNIPNMKPKAGEKLVFVLLPASDERENSQQTAMFEAITANVLAIKAFGQKVPYQVVGIPVDLIIDDEVQTFKPNPISGVYPRLTDHLNRRIAMVMREIATNGKKQDFNLEEELRILNQNKFLVVQNILRNG